MAEIRKYEVGTPEFIGAFRAHMQQGLAKENLDGVKFNYSWVGLNAPAHIAKGSAPKAYGPNAIGRGWSIRDGKIDVVGTPAPPEQNDFWLKADYERLRAWLKLTDK